jgi:predicted transposase YbfD/YdcC
MNNPIKMYFSEVEDPRKGANILYPLEEILLVAIVTFLMRGEGFEDMEDVGEYWIEELRKYYPFERGTPSADTFRYVFMGLDPRKFGDCFAQWMKHVHATVSGVIAIDGKSSRGSGRGESPISTVSAYCHERGVVMASIDSEDKSNEITVLPKLLEMLNLNNAVVTIDAMGCQKAVVEQVVRQKGDYLISLKGNQGRLHDEAKGFFEAVLENHPDFKGVEEEFEMDVHDYEQQSKSIHYRRRIAATSDFCPGMSAFRKEWKKLQSIVMIESWRTEKGQTSFERRFAITSLEADAKCLSEIIRNHWSVENNLHWMLDVCFQDDACTVRDRIAAKNIAILKRMAFNILKEHRKTMLKKKSIRRMRLTAGMSASAVHAMIKTASAMSLQ